MKYTNDDTRQTCTPALIFFLTCMSSSFKFVASINLIKMSANGTAPVVGSVGASLPQASELEIVLATMCGATAQLAKEIAETLGAEVGCKTAIDYHIYFNGLRSPPDRGFKEVDAYIRHVSDRKDSWKRNGAIIIAMNRANIVCDSI